MARAERLNHCTGYIISGDHRFGARGAERSKCDMEKFSKSDFVRIGQLRRRLARSVINRSSPVCHRTIPRAECVSVCTGEFSQCHNFWGLGPPKVLFADFYHVSRPVASSFINRSPQLYHRTIALVSGVNVRVGHFSVGVPFGGWGPPNLLFCPFYTSAAYSELIYQPIDTVLPLYDSPGLRRQ